MAGYLDPRYYAGMLHLVPSAFAAEERWVRASITETARRVNHDDYPATHQEILNGLNLQLSALLAGAALAQGPAFTASFDDPLYGMSWRGHAKGRSRNEKEWRA